MYMARIRSNNCSYTYIRLVFMFHSTRVEWYTSSLFGNYPFMCLPSTYSSLGWLPKYRSHKLSTRWSRLKTRLRPIQNLLFVGGRHFAEMLGAGIPRDYVARQTENQSFRTTGNALEELWSCIFHLADDFNSFHVTNFSLILQYGISESRKINLRNRETTFFACLSHDLLSQYSVGFNSH